MPSPVSFARAAVLLIDSDRRRLADLTAWLQGCGCKVQTAETAAEARRKLRRGGLDLLLARADSAELAAPELVRLARDLDPPVPAVLFARRPDPELILAVERAGVDEILALPPTDADLERALARAWERRQSAAEHVRQRTRTPLRPVEPLLFGGDPRMERLRDMAERAAETKATVLITGESGTGKSLLARWIHRRSPRAAQPFVEVACGALPETLLESELFGHRPGAFTGAVGNKIGRFEQADGGTLFLDEIATASPALQVKLLRVLQELQFEPVGGTETLQVDTRLILATHEDLGRLVREGRFRHDLYYRINIVNLELPPLRERPGDVRRLADEFLRRAVVSTGRASEGISEEVYRAFEGHAWPGNVRELENVIERAIVLGRGPRIVLEDLPPNFAGGSAAGAPVAADLDPRSALKSVLAGPERRIILEALERNRWHRGDAAKALGIDRTTLYKKMKRLGLEIAARPAAV